MCETIRRLLRLPSATVILQTNHFCSYSFLNPRHIWICRSSFSVTALCVHHPVPHIYFLKIKHLGIWNALGAQFSVHP